MAHALVLNATYEPLCVVTGRRALVLVLAGKAVTVEAGDVTWHSERASFRLPVVVKLVRFVRVPYRGSVPLTRRAIFARDGGRCVYCTAPATSIDHVIPRSRGGVTSWENVVCSCVPCNLRKGGRTPEEAHMKLTRPPARPRWTPFFRGPPRTGAFYQQWLPFLTLSDMAYWNTELDEER